MTQTQIATIAALRAQIGALERHDPAPARTAALPFGLPAIDQRLPAGGLQLGAIHELQGAGPDVETAAVPALFIAGALARRPGPVVWISRGGGMGALLFGHGLLQAGLDPGRVLVVEAGQAALLAMEDALRHAGIAGVVCELEGTLGLTASRRLQLAAQGSEALGFLLRRSRRFDDPALVQPSAAMTRWRIGAVPSPPALAHAPDVPGLRRPLWQVDLLRCRGAEGASWIVEGADAQGCLALAAVLAHRAAAPARRRAAG